MPQEGRTDYSVLFCWDTWFCKKIKKKEVGDSLVYVCSWKSWPWACRSCFPTSWPFLGRGPAQAGSHQAVLALPLQQASLCFHSPTGTGGLEGVTATYGSVLSLGKDRCKHLRERLDQVRWGHR